MGLAESKMYRNSRSGETFFSILFTIPLVKKIAIVLVKYRQIYNIYNSLLIKDVIVILKYHILCIPFYIIMEGFSKAKYL